MHLSRRNIQRGHHLHGFRVTPLAVRKTFDREFVTSLRVVLRAQELRELLVGGKNVVVDCLRDLLGQPLLVLFRKLGWKLLRGLEKGVRSDNAVALTGQLLEHELGRH